MSGATWKTGQPCRVVEHDPETHEPQPYGQVYEATVTWASSIYAHASSDDMGAVAFMAFYQGSGWAAMADMYRWRLMPAVDTATAAGEGNV